VIGRRANPRGRAWRLAVASLCAAGLGALGVTCSLRNLDIDITSNGLLTALAACDGIGHICDGKIEATCDRIFCDWVPVSLHPPEGICQIHEACTLAVSGAHTYQSNAPTALQLILLSTNPTQLQSASPCLCFDEGDFICPVVGADAGSTVTDCWSAAINAKLASSVPDGLTFSGFSDPDQGVLAMAWFQPSSGASCADFADAGATLCVEENLVACAGLGAPPGGQTYDITCASCQGGVHGAIGNDNGPCLTEPNECFLQTCAEALF
jgi:hypothetical protein